MRLAPSLATLFAAALSVLAACSKPPTQFDTSLETKEVMAHIVNPSAVALWNRAGDWTDESGIHDLAPISEDEWFAGESEAAVVAEAGNLLLIPERVRRLNTKDTDWIKFATLLSARANDVKKATEDRNKEAMFDSGGKLYEVCVSCHEKYYIPFLKDDDEPTAAPRRNDD